MATTFGSSPRDGLGEIIKTKDLAYITSSGMYNLQITSATYNKVTSAKNGNEYQFIRLTLVKMYQDNPVAKADVSVFMSADSQQLQDLVYFANIRDANGNLYLDDPVEHRWAKADGTPVLDSAGQQLVTYDFKQLINKRVTALLEFKGMSVSATGKQYPSFDLKAFVSENGQSAAEHAFKQPAQKYVDLIKNLTARQNQSAGPMSQQNIYQQAVPQQSPAPQQHIYTPQPGERVLVPQQVPQQNPAPQPYAQQMIQNSQMGQMFGVQPAQKINPDTINDNDLPF